jgi:hypothetical protein
MNGYQRVQNADPALDDFAAKVADAVIAKERPDAGSVPSGRPTRPSTRSGIRGSTRS